MHYWICLYHLVWATQYRQPTITPPIEILIHDAIRTKATDLRGTILAVNGTADHLHVAAAIPPSIAVSKWVGDIKGASARAVNIALPDQVTRFHWQSGYGAITFGSKQQTTVLEYIEQQKERHRVGNVYVPLETIEDD